MSNTEETKSTPDSFSQMAHPNAHSYYSTVQEQGLAKRSQSSIYHSRNVTNWIKSILIQQYIQRLKSENQDRTNEICVFDMGCGKGGDIPKWTKSNIKSIVFADIAENLVKLCKDRFHERKCRIHAEFYTLDCATELLRDKLKERNTQFDLVSSQLVLHYSFESYEKADRFLRNAAELLRIGGYFIGTTINAHRLVHLCRNAKDQTISNDVFKIRFDESVDLKSENGKQIPLFGAKYHFTLENVVDCPEYLVYFPLLVELAKKHGLELMESKTFNEYFHEHCDEEEGRFLLEKMDTLKRCDRSLIMTDETKQYEHTQAYFAKTSDEDQTEKKCRSISKQEWEVNSLYIIFAFKKTKSVSYDDSSNNSP